MKLVDFIDKYYIGTVIITLLSITLYLYVLTHNIIISILAVMFAVLLCSLAVYIARRCNNGR